MWIKGFNLETKLVKCIYHLLICFENACNLCSDIYCNTNIWEVEAEDCEFEATWDQFL